jgi:chondroitin 4-sulfotransferase 11
MFVRHPFERLASAYKERIATLAKDRIQPEPHYDNVRKMICRRYAGFPVGQNPLLRRNACDDFIPSFEHFVQYILINTETPVGIARMDGHWKPYAVVCQVCQFKYNFIGKYETFNDDFASLLKRLNVSDWNNQKRRGASGHTTRDYQQLFSSLPDDLICRLKRLYNDDFRLFNYRVEDYVNRTTLIC